MTKLNCIAVDDEPLALELIAKHISRVPELHLVEKCKNAEMAETVLKQNKIDLIFLDIQMPGKSGVELAQHISPDTMIVFTTAYEKYALEGYELNALDYLLKPIEIERFKAAAEKAISRFKLIQLQNEKTSEFIIVRSEYQTLKVFFNDILYVEGLKDYVKIFTSTNIKPILTRQNLKTFEGQLPASLFMRVHKSYIVPFKKVNSSNKINLMVGNKEIPIGETYKEEFIKKYFSE